ncbi:MAG: NAD(P)-dependent oxidoreductase, partial [Flavobacterium sp.]|nr:NAD(P)-dependent oxidoreductase [Flavobacterium sp.]
MVVLVTGAGGQLGQSLRFIAKKHPEIDFVFCDSKELDITNKFAVEAVFNQTKPDFCINAAAYTAVDKAEAEYEKANLINVTGSKNLAEVCKESNVILLHISTDFVFDGVKKTPYKEIDNTNPNGV